MSSAAAILGPAIRAGKGPALGRAPLPLGATMLSALIHIGVCVGLVFGAQQWQSRQPKTYVVNLVPAVAAVGRPQPKPQPTPSRTEEPAPRVARPAPSELPPRSTPGELPQRSAPAELPQRSTPGELPQRSAPREMPARESAALPTRAPAAPRADDKELPTVASATPARPPSSMASGPRAAVPPPPPPPPIGRPTGSPQGTEAVTLNVSDFPFAWYLSAVQRKITERWEGRALQGRQPVAVFEIDREGRVARLAIEKTSGNPYYDQAALRAITEATPFPPLPADFPERVLRIHLSFNFAIDRG